ncbi:multidrug ABC transporter ATP-binding protein [Exiguobacterium sp. Leaf187]|uniref:ABC transporter ATP-binding protein n=1 Tax=Exiguobacterium indicum TaxID=296995 RepID=A0A0V8GGJ1_9BACL|nr:MULTISPECIES: ABC transporter ATP-binding protein [Exiguobacterium]AHA29355.1 multidrug ABC transporter ATP-binding protein [Exiguobacterium sp. MH3]KQS18398.1 multidrug ABC transporter ATP-binding protein [Exiguobacterium sp. Leaf187]KSU49380.1 multidrug ABC transporter ATP-binding protein [Exiguobacterium enclense]MCQ4090818.1 ABC transporter ATP-binding protein/permease [Exiguobacterium sp. LL15]NTY09012.1 ABC transporter ATP-binding protein [Exiguobacterium sp. JMULE1]
MLRRFYQYYIPHKRLFWLDFISALFVGVLELAFPLAVQWFIDSLLPNGEMNWIILVSVGLLALYIISTLMQFVVNYFGHKLGINIETDMRRQLFSHVQKQSFRFFDNTKTGHIMSRITNDLFDIGELAHHGPEDAFIAVMTLLGAFSIMLTINVPLALVTIIAVPFLIWLISYANVRMNKSWDRMYGNIAEVNSRVEDSVSGVRVVQSFTNEAYEIERFEKDNATFRQSKINAYKVMSKSLSGIYLTTRLMTLAVLVVGAYLTYREALTAGELVGFILYMNILLKPIDKITALLEMYPKGMAGFKRFLSMIDEDASIPDAPDALVVDRLNGGITFKDVAFGYEADRLILENINLTVEPGQTVAFVGTSGAGKTTICSLIPRFYDVLDGAITIDGIDIRQMTKESLRQQIGIVQQDVFLFSGTIAENIAYGDLNATHEDIVQAAERAHLGPMIADLPDGYATQIGERGLKLSGGQKQRLAIARMFLKNPPILILDEATSALDTETEALIQESLAELSENRTTLVIAHRLATIRNADKIFVVTKDGIVEEGSHDELMNQGGYFSRLLERQRV